MAGHSPQFDKLQAQLNAGFEKIFGLKFNQAQKEILKQTFKPDDGYVIGVDPATGQFIGAHGLTNEPGTIAAVTQGAGSFVLETTAKGHDDYAPDIHYGSTASAVYAGIGDGQGSTYKRVAEYYGLTEAEIGAFVRANDAGVPFEQLADVLALIDIPHTGKMTPDRQKIEVKLLAQLHVLATEAHSKKNKAATGFNIYAGIEKAGTGWVGQKAKINTALAMEHMNAAINAQYKSAAFAKTMKAKAKVSIGSVSSKMDDLSDDFYSEWNPKPKSKLLWTPGAKEPEKLTGCATVATHLGGLLVTVSWSGSAPGPSQLTPMLALPPGETLPGTGIVTP